MPRLSGRPRRPRGAAVLSLVVAALVAAVLWTLRQQGTLRDDLRLAGEQHRQIAAFQAAQSGLDAIAALLNDPVPRGRDCRAAPGADAGETAAPFRERVLEDPLAGTSRRVGSNTPLSCRHDGLDWSCACPDDNRDASIPAPGDDRDHPAFTIQLNPGPSAFQNTVLVARSTGCRAAGTAACGDTPASPSVGGRSRIEQGFAPLGRWSRLPPATLAATGPMTLARGPRVIGPSPGTGVATLVSGATVTRDPTARLEGAPGTPDAATVLDRVPGLASTTDAWLRHLADLPGPWWRRLPTVHTLDCAAVPCGWRDVADAVAGHRTALWIDGDLVLDGSAPLGSSRHPLLLAARGHVTIHGGVQGWGVLLGSSIRWLSDEDARWQGTLISASTLDLSGPITVIGDLDLARRAAARSTAWVGIPGSWREVRDAP